MTTNIGESTDPFYRYKRPLAIVENKAGKTEIINLNAISKALHTKSVYILYYIQQEKSIPVTPKGGIKSTILNTDIEKLLNNYTKLYILCQNCGLPELVINITPEKKLYFSCSACGSTRDIAENKFTKVMYKDLVG